MIFAHSMLAQTDGGIFRFLHTMRGPDFLLLFGIWFIVTFGCVLLFRWRGQDTPFTTLTGLLCFEALGAARIMDGAAHGLHKWGFLILMMIVGGIIFIIRTEHFNSQGGDGSGGWDGVYPCRDSTDPATQGRRPAAFACNFQSR